MSSGFAFGCDYCGTVKMHEGQVPTNMLGGGYTEPNPPHGWVRILRYRGNISVSSVQTFCSNTCAMGSLGAAALEAGEQA